MRQIILLLITAIIFSSCNENSIKNFNGSINIEAEIEKCIAENLNDKHQDIYRIMATIEKYLIENNYLVNNDKESYQQLLFFQLHDKLLIDTEFISKNKNELDFILTPKILSTLHNCFLCNLEREKINTQNNKPDVIFKLLNKIIESGDLGDWVIINDYFNSLSKIEFQKPVYKLFIVFLVCQVSLQKNYDSKK